MLPALSTVVHHAGPLQIQVISNYCVDNEIKTKLTSVAYQYAVFESSSHVLECIIEQGKLAFGADGPIICDFYCQFNLVCSSGTRIS